MSNNEFKVIQLTVNDWQMLKQIRTDAVNSHSDVFAPSIHPEKLSDDEWKNRLSNPASVSFVIIDEKTQAVVGLTGVYLEGGDANSEAGHMISSFIKNSHKGTGLSKLLYQARIDWAKKHHRLKRLVLEQRETNTGIKCVHQKFGFKFLQKSQCKFADGTIAKTEIFELNL